ncbi:MAG TPA: TetR/AcrR family transcriptional regulator [Hyphomonas sp.]|nr:TetR/AcrR family transcriptional regulator [Hyphomonas sp.]MCA8905320.1 TetR/AcrR family transcriptional regulator [Hyphomonas sp.]MCB9962510.1 TetR/AcrR family transcriptional regulator [Hyphomonas sp.]MCB9972038.1 TetR/AcrR family transcriptional regulator [Hyphomonas sp.]HPE49350.1 TetR/AcrR family transcriptional regulator [Hyphomonas sp.]
MSRSRFENLEPDKQQRLIDSAAEEFAAKGYDAASLNRILELAGMSKSSLYYYFDDKADLFTTLVDRSLAYLFRQVGGFDDSKLTAENFWDEMEATALRFIMLGNSNAWYVKMGRMFYRLRSDPAHSAPTERSFAAARRWLTDLVRKGQALGAVRTDLPETLMVDAAMGLGEALDLWVLRHWDELPDEARLRMAHDQVGLFRRLLSP